MIGLHGAKNGRRCGSAPLLCDVEKQQTWLGNCVDLLLCMVKWQAWHPGSNYLEHGQVHLNVNGLGFECYVQLGVADTIRYAK